MQLTPFHTGEAPQPGGAYSQALAGAGIVALAGQVGKDPKTGKLADGIQEQVEQSISNLEAVLASAGAGLDAVIKTTCFVADIADFDAFDEVYRRMFREPYPARSTVAVGLKPGVLFEIEAWAILPS